MANPLTGDYDVVVQFSTGAVNRILAAMHSGNRLLHSLSTRIDDNPVFSRLVTAVMAFARNTSSRASSRGGSRPAS